MKPQRILFQKNNGTIWSLFPLIAYESEHVPGGFSTKQRKGAVEILIDEIYHCESHTITFYISEDIIKVCLKIEESHACKLN